jgi:hypothetical protein
MVKVLKQNQRVVPYLSFLLTVAPLWNKGQFLESCVCPVFSN